LIAFITLAVTENGIRHFFGLAPNPDYSLFKPQTHTTNFLELQAKLIVWIFAMRFLMDFMSGASYFINQYISERKYKGKKEFDFEQPLTRLIWIASILCISTSFFMSWLLIGDLSLKQSDFDANGEVVRTIETISLGNLWWQLAIIISCGTLAAVLI